MSKVKKQRLTPARVFRENPYDIETFFESFSIASRHEKELLYVDRFISKLRKNPEEDITKLTFEILTELDIIKLDKL